MTAPARLVLVRHGRSALASAAGWVDVHAVRGWRASYDDAGIADGSLPPPSLVATSANALVVASDLPRAIASAERLAVGRVVTTSPLLRETMLAIPRWLPGRWPMTAWEAAIHAQWAWQRALGTDASPAERDRAGAAAAWLAALDGGIVVAVTHGVFRRLLARRLLVDGWRATSGPQRYHHWSAWQFESRAPSRSARG